MRPRHVIVCLIDAAAVKHMSLYGYHRKTTPNIDALASEGVLFRKCFSPANYTMAGCGCFHTGRYAENHGAFYLERRLKPDDLTFAETMRRAGYTTLGWSENMYSNSYMGYDIGFDRFDDMKDCGEKSRKRGTEELSELELQMHARFKAALEQIAGGSLFAYLHFLPPHGDYETPKRFLYTWAKPEHAIPDTTGETLMGWEQGRKPYTQRDVEYVRDLYDENMLYADHNVGLVIDRLKESGVWEETLFILMSDHGEAFMEHGFTLHNTTLYDEMIHVPLVMKLPAGVNAAVRDVGALVEIIDIYPSVADLLGVCLPEGTVDGRSFMPLVTGKAGSIKDYTLSRSAHSVTPILSVRTERHKYIFDQRTYKRELYDLLADPLEKTNIIGENGELASELHRLLAPALEYYRGERESAGIRAEE